MKQALRHIGINLVNFVFIAICWVILVFVFSGIPSFAVGICFYYFSDALSFAGYIISFAIILSLPAILRISFNRPADFDEDTMLTRPSFNLAVFYLVASMVGGLLVGVFAMIWAWITGASPHDFATVVALGASSLGLLVGLIVTICPYLY